MGAPGRQRPGATRSERATADSVISVTATAGDLDNSLGSSVHSTNLGGHFSMPLHATDDVGNEFSLHQLKSEPIGYTVVDGRPTLRSSPEEPSLEHSRTLTARLQASH